MEKAYKMIDFSTVIDWISFKLLGAGIGLYLLKIHIPKLSEIAGYLSVIALLSTIVYNGVKIYKELKKKK